MVLSARLYVSRAIRKTFCFSIHIHTAISISLSVRMVPVSTHAMVPSDPTLNGVRLVFRKTQTPNALLAFLQLISTKQDGAERNVIPANRIAFDAMVGHQIQIASCASLERGSLMATAFFLLHVMSRAKLLSAQAVAISIRHALCPPPSFSTLLSVECLSMAQETFTSSQEPS